MTGKTMTADEAIDTIWKLAKQIDFCMFVTWDGERQRARPLSARPRREEGRIYFLIDVAGAKDDQIERFPIVTLAFADIRAHDYVTITGRATVGNDRAKIAELWGAADKAFWKGPEDASIRLLSVEPDDAELWKGSNRLVAGAKLLTAAVTGAKVDLGENVKVDHL
jgi:general stress protein 26